MKRITRNRRLTPEEGAKYGWQNDPKQVRLPGPSHALDEAVRGDDK